MSIEIRRAVVADAETVLTMMGELAEYQDERADVKASLADWQGFLGREDVIVLIAEVDGAVAGYVSALRRPYLWVGGDQLALDDLYVREQFRDRGVGRELMLGLARHALPERLPIGWGLRIDNTAGYRFYERLGARLVTKTAAGWSPEAYERQLNESRQPSE
ncbi:GNAT family N-acetyltransferase [Kribbella shirazensis]|uniref:Ribosomal protein S18 acetylase RimI-like enzyme n=1 Tax=Kribbella shirazensis TaxID=1105143 RepID=A0A7X5ZXV7_9ACTN|nr:GNAT family N-acetyltransferase [Kribbella shirazensis]NIK54366.1 ribosomal protein S18 acetylase RimI-like enzyme [Kribbella shirazensis]